MKYVLQELRNRANIFKNSRVLHDYYIDYNNAANNLENNVPVYCSDEVFYFLKETLGNIVSGLITWGDGYEEQRKMQERRAAEFNAAIDFFRPLCPYCGNRTICEGSYPEGCFLENQISDQKKQ